MKKIIFLILLVLCCTSSVFGGKFEDTLKKAEQGHASAQNTLAYMYSTGDGVPQDKKKCVYWYKKAAENGDANAQFNLGIFYERGIYGVVKDYQKAIKWYKLSAEQGYASAFCNIGDMYLYGAGVSQDYLKAIAFFKKGAVQEDSACQYALANIYREGKGVYRDYSKAIYWYKEAYNGNFLNAPFDIANMYYRGEGVLQSYKKALDWYKKAMAIGFIDAVNIIGEMYFYGEGVPQNYKQAYAFFSVAAASGYKKSIANANKNITARKLSPQQLVEAQELAAKIQYQIDHPSETQRQPSPKINDGRKVIGSGTGFIITKDGYVLTCHHVIENANGIKIAIEGNTYQAKIVRDDPNNDLSLLKINGSFPAIAFSSKRSANMGQEVFTIGYPNPSLQGVNAKITKGIVNSLTGFQDDIRLYQISVPVQPGNSGGALVDENGNVLGVIVAMLDAKTTFKISGSLPQNVNYAVKSTYALAMLDTLPEISDKLITSSSSKSNAVARVKKSTVMVLSYK